MRNNIKGFTIVEIIVVIVIIGILGTLAGSQVLRSQLVARDKERENDVKIIASTLERVYMTGQLDGAAIPSGDPLLTTAVPMSYPSTLLISSTTDAQTKAILGAIDPNAMKSPIKKAMSLVGATSNAGVTSSTTAAGKTINATAADDVYVYQPLHGSDDSLCPNANTSNASQSVIAPRLAAANPCDKFKIYYFSETSSTIKVLVSKNDQVNGL